MGYSVPLMEQEIVVQASRDLKYATAYVTDRTYMTKLDKMVERDGEHYGVIEVHKVDGDVVGKTYRFPKKLLSFRSGNTTRGEMTEEEKKKRAEGLARWREAQAKKVEE